MKKQILATIATTIILVTQSGCGQSNSIVCPAGMVLSNNSCIASNPYNYPYSQTGAYNTCQANTFPTIYGCLPKGNCQANQAYYAQQNTCVNITTTTNTGYNNGYNGNPYGSMNTCPAGQFPTQVGCLSQGQCQNGTAFAPMYNTCVPVITYTNGMYGNGYMNGGYYGNTYNPYGSTQCGAGYSPTTRGCLPTGNCQYPMGSLNGTCVY
jgi:hypothetical protein